MEVSNATFVTKTFPTLNVYLARDEIVNQYSKNNGFNFVVKSGTTQYAPSALGHRIP